VQTLTITKSKFDLQLIHARIKSQSSSRLPVKNKNNSKRISCVPLEIRESDWFALNS